MIFSMSGLNVSTAFVGQILQQPAPKQQENSPTNTAYMSIQHTVFGWAEYELLGHLA